MSGVFSVPHEGLYNVSVDDLLEHARASRYENDRPQEQVDNDVCADALKQLAGWNLPGLMQFKDADGRPFLTGYCDDAFGRLKGLLDRIPDGRLRRTVIHKLRRHMAGRRAALLAREAETERKIDYLRCVEIAVGDMQAWQKNNTPKLERPLGTMLHKFRDALAANRVLDIREVQCEMGTGAIADWAAVAASAEVFIVEHNWAAAFRGGVDYDFGEIHLPAECCAFEFRMCGRSVIAFATEVEGAIYVQHAFEAANEYWVVCELLPHAIELPAPGPFAQLSVDSIRAIVIALDAEVAETTVVRAPHKLNAARERRGKLPIASYHIVSLASRSRVARLDRDANEPPSHHKRLHFRRGHWRHFETWKTWIRWTLVGDPDLGFVDKHYRL